MTEAAKPGLDPQKRVRASEHALKAAIKAMQECGLSVEKLSISGGRIEIHCGAIEGVTPTDEYAGLEKW